MKDNIKKVRKALFKRVEYDKELRLAKMNEAYHRKHMEYFQEEIKLLKNEKRI